MLFTPFLLFTPHFRQSCFVIHSTFDFRHPTFNIPVQDPNFHQRLEQAIQRGQHTRTRRRQAEAERALSEQELQRLHSQYRLELSERIEKCLRDLVDSFPGFRYETIIDERGWGAIISRDDVVLGRGRQRPTAFSRLEMVIRPLSSYFVLELAAKATIYNKEYFNRSHYQKLADVDADEFIKLIDVWALEYAELYAARN